MSAPAVYDRTWGTTEGDRLIIQHRLDLIE
jgi:hypothetical protein